MSSVTIEKAIDSFYQDNERSVATIIEGSDEHLDMILSITKPLALLTEKFRLLNEKLVINTRNYTDEQLAKDLTPKLRNVNKSCVLMIGALRTSFLYRDVRVTLKDYSIAYDQFKEILHDLHCFRLTKDPGMDNLLKELNDL